MCACANWFSLGRNIWKYTSVRWDSICLKCAHICFICVEIQLLCRLLIETQSLSGVCILSMYFTLFLLCFCIYVVNNTFRSQQTFSRAMSESSLYKHEVQSTVAFSGRVSVRSAKQKNALISAISLTFARISVCELLQVISRNTTSAWSEISGVQISAQIKGNAICNLRLVPDNSIYFNAV